MNQWLATNGIGGFAMGSKPSATISCNSRRYHGLLIAATCPPVGRIVALHSVIDQVKIGNLTADLATQQFAPIESPVTHPGGWQHLKTLIPQLPNEIHWTYAFNDTRITRSLQLLSMRNAAKLTWSCTNTRAELHCRIFTPLRDFHALTSEHDPSPNAQLLDDQTLHITHFDLQLQLQLSRGSWQLDPQWWRNFYYAHDHARGQRCTEDLWSPGWLTAPLDEPAALHLELIQPHHIAPQTSPSPTQAATPDHNAAERLRCAAEQFIVQRRSTDAWSTSIIAGYPWFADWGRDTMISLEGLLLCTGKFDQAQATLLTFARHIRSGLVPNRFDDYGNAAHYNTVDASLWFIHAVHALHQHRPTTITPELITACRSIITAYRKGTEHNIHMDSDGLIAAGAPDTQLTWMDAQRDGITFTPRHGKAVEISALWYHALHCLAAMTDDPAERADLLQLADLTSASMQSKFWNPARSCCYDVLTSDAAGHWIPDDAVRPNQIFAASLAHSPLTPAQRRSIINITRQRLLTPYGLRTLEPGHPQYQGRFEGDMLQRDSAYHQGTVWPWLIGPYAEAVLRAERFSDAAKAEVAQCIQTLLDELDTGCFGQIAEIYDGDPPHRPAGCPAQAWSVAELLRIITLIS